MRQNYRPKYKKADRYNLASKEKMLDVGNKVLLLIRD